LCSPERKLVRGSTSIKEVESGMHSCLTMA
jgi:hypothetical protein